MTRTRFLAGVVLSASLSLPGTVLAQAPAFDAAGLAAACGAGSCVSTVKRIIAQLKQTMTPAQVNAQLAIIANVVIQVAKENPAAAVEIAAALREVSAGSTDPGQIAAILQVAELVAGGGAPGLDIGTAVAGSPA